MKKFLLPALMVLTLASACKKNDDNIPATMQLSGTLSGANEVPAVTTSATGNVTGTYDPSSKLLTYSVAYSGLTPTSGHLHVGAPGANGDVAVIFPSVASSPITGTATLTQNQADALVAGNMYANLHTNANKAGEIRANVVAK